MDDPELRQTKLSLSDLVVMPCTLLVLAVVSLFLIDGPIGAHFAEFKPSGEIEDFINTAEHFGTPYGQFLILFCISVASSCQDRRVYRIFIGTCAAGLAANALKLCTGRIRPREFDFDHLQILESFTSWFPFHSGGSAMESFPSAHTASAFGFAALLTWAYPKGRSAFLSLAFLVALQRITKSAHFPSDVFAGAALGWWIGLSFIGKNWGTVRFNRFEQAKNHTQFPFAHQIVSTAYFLIKGSTVAMTISF